MVFHVEQVTQTFLYKTRLRLPDCHANDRWDSARRSHQANCLHKDIMIGYEIIESHGNEWVCTLFLEGLERDIPILYWKILRGVHLPDLDYVPEGSCHTDLQPHPCQCPSGPHCRHIGSCLVHWGFLQRPGQERWDLRLGCFNKTARTGEQPGLENSHSIAEWGQHGPGACWSQGGPYRPRRCRRRRRLLPRCCLCRPDRGCGCRGSCHSGLPHHLGRSHTGLGCNGTGSCPVKRRNGAFSNIVCESSSKLTPPACY